MYIHVQVCEVWVLPLVTHRGIEKLSSYLYLGCQVPDPERVLCCSGETGWCFSGSERGQSNAGPRPLPCSPPGGTETNRDVKSFSVFKCLCARVSGTHMSMYKVINSFWVFHTKTSLWKNTNKSTFSMLRAIVSPSPTPPGSCPEFHQTAYPPQTWSPHDSSSSNTKTNTKILIFLFLKKPFNPAGLCVFLGSYPFTNRRQVAHHKEGCEGGVKEEGNPLGGCSWDAQAAHAGCVCYKNREQEQ